VEYVKPPPPWEEGRQGILNALEAQMPEHTFKLPVPVVVRIVWENDGEEHIETEALGWSNGDAYVRLPDSRWKFTSVWLRAEDVKRR
jgi:hypothetical protein